MWEYLTVCRSYHSKCGSKGLFDMQFLNFVFISCFIILFVLLLVLSSLE